MKSARKYFLIGGAIAFVAMSAAFTIALAKPEGARIASPFPGAKVDAAFDVAGDAWFAPDAKALADIRVVADGPGGLRVEARMERLVVKDRGRLLLELSRWRGRFELPSEGVWTLRAEARSAGGDLVASAPRQVSFARGGTKAFLAFSPEHGIPVLLILAVAIAAVVLVRRAGGIPPLLAWSLSIAIWANEFIYQSIWFAQGGWSTASSLMVQMCGLVIVLLPFALLMDEGRGRARLAELLWFWGIGGATQALLSPDVGASGFPALRYFSFFISHGLIIVTAAALAAEKPARIDLGALGRVFLFTNLLLVPIACINAVIALLPAHDPGNYFILSYPPPDGSPVDFLAAVFGPAPRYLIGLELLAGAIFCLLWFPFALARRLARVRRAAGS